MKDYRKQPGPAERKFLDKHETKRKEKNERLSQAIQSVTIKMDLTAEDILRLRDSLLGVPDNIDHAFNEICLDAERKKAARGDRT